MKQGTKITFERALQREKYVKIKLDKFKELIQSIKDFMPDHVVVELDNGIIINSTRVDDTETITRMAKALSLTERDYSFGLVDLDPLGKTPEFWEENAKLAKIAQAATALAEAAKVNGLTVDDISPIVISMAKKNTTNGNLLECRSLNVV